MSVDVVSRITIDRPVAAVAAYAGDPDNAPAWYVNIASVEWRTDPPLQVGSRLAFVAHFLGRRLEYVYEVTEQVPGERLTMRTSAGPFPMETRYVWRDDDGATEMTLRNVGSPRGFGTLLAPFVALAMRRANRKDLERLKAILEREGGARSGTRAS